MQSRRLLIVSSDPAATRELGSRLVSLGHTVVAIARSPAEVAAMTDGTKPDLLFLEAPAGAERQARREAGRLQLLHDVPAVLVTTDAGESRLLAGGPVDPHEYVTRPLRDRELRLTIELALGRHDGARVARELEDRFFAVAIDMLCFLGFDGYFRRLNPAWERTLGFTRGELMSRPFIEFVHPDDRERTLRQNREVREGGRALGFENRYLCSDGSYRWFLWNAAPDPGERMIYSVARDVTERKRAEEEREALVRELQAALDEVSALRGILPICSYCRRIRDDENYWQTVESYVARHARTQFSHGICPSCMETEVEPQLRGLKGV